MRKRQIGIYLNEERDMKMYPDMYGRDEIFFRLGVEQSDDLLQRIKTVENPNFQDDNGTSYLHRACQRHYLEAIKLLLNMGADPNINDKKGVSPKAYTSHISRPQVCELSSVLLSLSRYTAKAA